MTTAPRWEDSDQGDLLELVALGSMSSPSPEEEWLEFVAALHYVAQPRGGIVDPNAMRELVRDVIAPRRVGAFYSRAVARDLIAPTGDWVVSDDVAGKNSGKPCRVYRLVTS